MDRLRATLKAGLARWSSKRWQIAQCAIAAGVAWFIAESMLGHHAPVFAAVAAVVSLGTSYGQRLRRVAEVTVGVAIGVLMADLLVTWLGAGGWQIVVIVALSMSVALMLDSGRTLVNQAAVQGIFVSALATSANASLTRWTDALVGGAVALVAATVVPAAPLRRPRAQAAVVVHKIADLLRAAGEVILEMDPIHAMAVLTEARATDGLIRELSSAADEGMAVVASSPFRIRHKPHIRRMNDLVEPLDRAMRSTRVLVRQVAVAAYRGNPIPESYAALAFDLADATALLADDLGSHELGDGQLAEAARPTLLAVGEASGHVERSQVINAEATLTQIRAVIVDLLQLTGMGQFEATDALPPVQSGTSEG
ncbi:MAG: FUSC family protein [Nocardioides sp.]